jgi:hypothetical protein
MSTMTADWPADAVLYEIYPQSVADSDGDGVGDLRGVIEHLDHLGWLGVDTIWFNPLLDSPFVDAGYDVADYLRVAPRYGTNHDLVELVGKARDRGIRVLLDLVAGHTSLEHPWFQAELHADGPHPDGNRYVWRGDPPRTAGSGDVPGTPAWVRQPGPRRGWYLKNFYDAQRALNFGWGAPAHRRAVAGRRRRARPAPRLQGAHRRARLLAEPRRGRGSGWTWPSHWSRTIPAGRRRSRCGVRCAPGATSATPTPCSSPKEVHRATSAAHAETMLRRHVYPTFGDRPVAIIRSGEVQAWVKGLPLATSDGLRVTRRVRGHRSEHPRLGAQHTDIAGGISTQSHRDGQIQHDLPRIMHGQPLPPRPEQPRQLPRQASASRGLHQQRTTRVRYQRLTADDHVQQPAMPLTMSRRSIAFAAK